MTAKTEAPPSRRQRVRAWYRANPGFHRCMDVAAAMGETTLNVATASRTLMLAGELERHHQPRADEKKKPIVLYGINPASKETPK